MYCRNCGNEIGEGMAFCPNCGHRVIDVSAGRREDAVGQGAAYQYSNQSQNGNPDGMQYQNGGADWNAGEKGTSYSNANSYESQYQNQYPYQQPTDGFAIASLVLGILSFFALPIIGSILAIIFGMKSMRDNGTNTMARVGNILGISSLVIYVVAVVIFIILFFGSLAMMSTYTL